MIEFTVLDLNITNADNKTLAAMLNKIGRDGWDLKAFDGKKGIFSRAKRISPEEDPAAIRTRNLLGKK